MLKGAGYKLLTARNGDDTLTLAKAYPGEIYLLLTDIVMPRMKGLSSVARCQKGACCSSLDIAGS